jgi:hypothetical protein
MRLSVKSLYRGSFEGGYLVKLWGRIQSLDLRRSGLGRGLRIELKHLRAASFMKSDCLHDLTFRLRFWPTTRG